MKYVYKATVHVGTVVSVFCGTKQTTYACRPMKWIRLWSDVRQDIGPQHRRDRKGLFVAEITPQHLPRQIFYHFPYGYIIRNIGKISSSGTIGVFRKRVRIMNWDNRLPYESVRDPYIPCRYVQNQYISVQRIIYLYYLSIWYLYWSFATATATVAR